MDLGWLREFLQDHHRAVLVTRRTDGRSQTSPVLCGLGADGRVNISTVDGNIKTRNIRRHPGVSLCVLSDNFFGEWVQVDGQAEIISLPTAMDGLVDLYRTTAGEHPDWEDFRAAMVRDGRVLVSVTIERAGPRRDR